MFKSRSLVVVITCIALVAGSATALADPGNGKGQGHGNGNGNGQGGQGKKGKGGDSHYGPSVDRGSVLGVLGGYRDYWRPGPPLPPGIQKKIGRAHV